MPGTEITAFDNNVIEKCGGAPVWIRGEFFMLSKFDMTSTLSNNAKQYIEIGTDAQSKDAVINQTTVPYYFSWGVYGNIQKNLTINAGVTIYMANDADFAGSSSGNPGRLMINGTTDKPVRITRLAGTSQYWGRIAFNGLTGSVINNCIFEYGGYSSDREDAMIRLDGYADLTMTNVQINNSHNYGMQIDDYGGAYRLAKTNVTFANNYKGNVWDTRTTPYSVLPTLP